MPAEFGGPGGQWSPETLLVAACVDCFLLTFRSVAQASKLEWQSLDCEGEGIVDRVDGKTRFTGLALRARLRLPAGGGDPSRAQRILEKAERACLVTTSLVFERKLEAEVAVDS
jgi:organic hydroperoxide reductase OsmC/OhrA